MTCNLKFSAFLEVIINLFQYLNFKNTNNILINNIYNTYLVASIKKILYIYIWDAYIKKKVNGHEKSEIFNFKLKKPQQLIY